VGNVKHTSYSSITLNLFSTLPYTIVNTKMIICIITLKYPNNTINDVTENICNIITSSIMFYLQVYISLRLLMIEFVSLQSEPMLLQINFLKIYLLIMYSIRSLKHCCYMG